MTRKLFVLIGILALFSAADAVADVDAGVNIDWSKTEGIDNGDWGVGGRVDFGGSFRGMIAFDYFFINADDIFDEGDVDSDDFDLRFWELNGNVFFQFPTEGVHPYIGGGIGIARRSFDVVNDIFDDDQTELGVNVFGGMKFGEGAAEPFIEFRGTFYPDDDFIDIGENVVFGDRFVVSGGVVF